MNDNITICDIAPDSKCHFHNCMGNDVSAVVVVILSSHLGVSSDEICAVISGRVDLCGPCAKLVEDNIRHYGGQVWDKRTTITERTQNDE